MTQLMTYMSKRGLMDYIQNARNVKSDASGSKRKRDAQRRAIAIGEAGALGRLDLESYHALIDYRNDNEKIVRKAMTRKKAFLMNKRLTGTGFGWAACGGYPT